MTIHKLAENLWQIDFSLFGSCVYLFKYKKKNILVDTGAKWNFLELKKSLEELKTPAEKIDLVILTHGHFDHVGNISLFKNAKIYGSDKDFSRKENILDIKELNLPGVVLIETPGHSKGGVCLWFPKEKILFSGDTLFHRGIIGRTDIPGSNPSDMRKSLEKLTKLDFKILCPCHI
ncbi:Hydroxyacylglutathione hydrolase [uncultured archaeon]|nr:Hydroxyacylglutathione hydrolase [uncultured archaeon]